MAAVLAAAPLAAATVGPDWCVVYPEPIAISQPVNRALKIAAEEVRDDINEATGLSLRAVPASKAKPPAIYIGAEFAKKAGLDLSDLKWYDNAIAEKDGSIYLYGNDRAGRDPSKFKGNVGWFRCVLPSVKAATRFLETAVGVRFLMPGEVGKEVPKVNSVSLADGNLSIERQSLIYANGCSNDDRSLVFFVASGMWGMGPFHTYGGHTYHDSCPAEKYFKEHPEYFGLRNGKRVRDPSGQDALCISNPAVEDLIVAEMERQYDAGAEACQLGQNDGGKTCECEKCRELFGTGDDWGEKYWLFHRRIAERILVERPGKIVQILCYGPTRHPPKSFKVFPPNVMVETSYYSEQGLKEWRGHTVPHGFTVYVYLAGNYVMPGFAARHSLIYFATLAKRFRDNNVRGVYRCEGMGELFGTEGLAYYVFNKLLQAGSYNVKSLVLDYCKAAFGPAAVQMQKFYETQDARLRMCDRIVFDSFASDAAEGLDGYVSARPRSALDLHGMMFSPDTISAMEECLSNAERAEGLSAKHRKRLKLVRFEFDYAKLMGKISTLYSAYKLCPSEASFNALADVVEERKAYVETMYNGGKSLVCIDGWPELKPFRLSWPRSLMDQNGRMNATIGAPLNWNIKALRNGKAYPGTSIKTADVRRTKVKAAFGDFKSGSGWACIGGMSMEQTGVAAKFKAMYDDKNLYILVESDLRDASTGKAVPRDGACWNYDCIDVLIAPGMSRSPHYHLLWNVDPSSCYDDATGLIADPLDPMFGKPDVSWNGKGWQVECKCEGGKWRTIATIPYSDFGVAAPKPGDSWFVNVGRIAKAGADGKADILMLWSPNMETRSMADPQAMGRLTFR